MNRPPTPARGTSTTLRALPSVLLVGRSGEDAEAVQRLMEPYGYLVQAIAGAEEALERLRAERFDLVLLDTALQGMGSASFVEAMRADEHLLHVPLLLLSASHDVAAIEACLQSGADDFLPAAFGPAMLHTRISAAKDRRGARDNQMLRREMDVARNIQRDFLPETLPAVQGLQLEAALHPARQVSGDFYDAFPLASGSVFLVIGDVCDKGVGAALFMALFRSLIRASADPVGGGAIQMIGGRRTVVQQSLAAATPGDMLTRVAGFTNNYIARLHGRTNMFATVFMAVVDPQGKIDYLNAGHEPALIIGPYGPARELRPTGPALGMMPDAAFATKGARLEPGETLLSFTDGLVEARSPSGEVFGGPRLRALLEELSTTTAPQIVTGVVDALKAFGRQAEPHDDLTMLAATREQ